MNESWHGITITDVGRRLNSDLFNGLTTAEVAAARLQFGENVLPKGEQKHWWGLLLDQFKNTFVIILLIAAFLTLLIGEYLDTSVIIVAVLINCLIGFWQGYRSNTIFEKLRALVKVVATVERPGGWLQVNSSELVPGDIILLKAGEKVPADARIIRHEHLTTVEALLTGESSPVKKSADALPNETDLADRKCMVYTGTTVEEGSAEAIVVATGAKTEIGRIATLTASVEEGMTPLQLRLAKLTKTITIIVAIAASVILVTGLFENQPFVEIFTLAVAVAVAAIPEGLPAALSVVLAVASRKILSKNGLVKTLIGAETLGSTTVICTDKTGTLTEGVMRLESVHESKNESRAELALAFANEAVMLSDGAIKGESTDRSKLEYFLSKGGDFKKSIGEFRRLLLLPFDHVSKCIISFHQGDAGAPFLFTTGVPEYIVDRSTETKEEKERLHAVITQLAGKGYRLIGIAERELPDQDVESQESSALRSKLENLHFLGIAVIRDPIRKDVAASLVASREAGIRTIVITGDHPLTAKSNGQELGFSATNDTTLTGAELDALSEDALMEKIDRLEIVARATPEHKMRIVAALKAKNEVVAMTGDGGNDAPALKASDVGIALGSGTDVTKEAADLVLMNDSFSTITEAIRQGRVAFDNIRKVVVFLLSNSFTELIIVLVPLIAKVPLPITAIQVLWANLVEDGLPNFALAFEHGEKDVMKRKPLKKNENIIDQYGWVIILIQGLATDIVLVIVYFGYLHFYGVNVNGVFVFEKGYSIEHVRTVIFAIIATDSLLFVFSLKSSTRSIFLTNIFDNKYLILATGFGFSFMFLAVYTPFFNKILETVPLRAVDIAIVFGLGIFEIFFVEMIKVFYRRRNRSDGGVSLDTARAI